MIYHITWGITDIGPRNSWRPICDMSIPSIHILPVGSDNRNNVAINDDLPAPVRPTTPT